jgi:uncharacterized protein (TIGR02453 family)
VEDDRRDTADCSFAPGLFAFLRELADNNNREWFTANRGRYDAFVRDPALDFVNDFAPRLATISEHFTADARPVGGSLFRIHRDTRFSKDKTPYKTHTGIHFRHEQARDVHAPGFYIHLGPDSVWLGAGIWQPDTATLVRIRDAIDTRPDDWRRVVAALDTERYRRVGDALKRPPAGYDASHPLLDDMKRKSHVVAVSLSEQDATAGGFVDRVAVTFAPTSPFVAFLCAAVGVPF